MMKPFAPRTARLRVLLGALLAVGLLAPVLPPAQPALAAIFTVNSTLDAPDANPGDGICQTVVPGQCTLRAAIMEANALAGADTIVVPAGLYILTLARGSCGAEPIDACGDLDIFDSVTIQGAGAATTIVDASLINDRVFDIFAPSVTITGLTIQGGNTTTANEAGGGIQMVAGGSALVLGGPNAATDGVVVTGNTAGQDGGGITSFFGSLTLTNVTISNNRANGPLGGGISAPGVSPINMNSSSVTGNILAGCCTGGGGIAAEDLVTITNSTISNNVTQQAEGGGILMGCFNSCNGRLTLSNSTVSANQAAFPGGGISLECCNPHSITSSLIDANAAGAFGTTGFAAGGGVFVNDSSLAISLSVIRNNTTPHFGAGISFFCCGQLTVDQSQVLNNNAGSDSGGVDIDDGPAILTNSTINTNTSQGGSGGGIGFFDGPGFMTNVTVSGNQAPQGLGGGIFNDLGNLLTLTNVTVANNGAAAGGGIRTGGATLTAKNNLVANNTPQNCLNVTNSQGGNVETANTCGFSNTAQGDQINANAGIAPLADNGGPLTGPSSAPQGAAKTHALLAGSAALDAVPASNCPPPSTDERLLPRPVDGNGDGTPLCDSGAYEAQTVLITPTPTSTPTSTLTPTSTATPTPTSTPTPGGTPTPTPTACILGDINCDGIVDIRDYGIWRQNFGQIGCGNPADLNRDCIVDIQDYGIWRQNFGHTAGAAAPGAVPPVALASGTGSLTPGPTRSPGTP
jgi:CSLREA domain-containing protein